MASIRQSKLESLLKRDLSDIFQVETRGLGIKEMVTVTVVRVSPDMSFAKVYVSIFPSDNAQAVLVTLKEQQSYFRGLLGKKIGRQVRMVPEIAFYLDDSLDYADRIDQLLK
ncbi:30S ribosome-binding factor RbfA [bacterium SCSIO 12741]|nr:30S ribosome-binding factor RbfA [bacterium SCSIO 12741]